MALSTRQRLLDAGLAMLLERGYNDMGIQAVLDSTGTPRGSFYHHFESKEDFALQVVDVYMEGVHAGLDAHLSDTSRSPLDRIRAFFEAIEERYRTEGYLGCLLGGLGQELSGVSERFARKISGCLDDITERLAGCLEEARQQGELPAHADPHELADLLANCWEGAALRSRLRRDPAPLHAMLNFYLRAAPALG